MNKKLQKEETINWIAYRSRFGRCVDPPYDSLCDYEIIIMMTTTTMMMMVMMVVMMMMM
jgi:uncharacterized membrane protein